MRFSFREPPLILLSEKTPVLLFLWSNEQIEVSFACTIINLLKIISSLKLPKIRVRQKYSYFFKLQGISSHTVINNLPLRKGRTDIYDILWQALIFKKN